MIGWTIQTLIASAMLMAIVMLLRAPVARAFGANIAYALWLLPALRMILPAIPGWRALYVPLIHIEPGHSTIGLVDPATAAGLAKVPDAYFTTLHPEASATVARHISAIHAAPVDWFALLLLVWLGGAALWFGWQMIRYRIFLHRALHGAVPLSRECGIDVLLSDHVGGPVAAGILHRRIFLPADFITRYNSDERRLALKHEAAHHDRLDLPANLAALLLVALHWWNPLAHRAYKAFRADQELACDATVLADARPSDRLAYGAAMLKSASARTPVVACALSHKDQLKRRIRMMTNKPVGALRLLCGGMLAVAAIGGGLLLTASGQAAAPYERTVSVPPVAPVEAVTPIDPVPPAPAVAAAHHRAAEAQHEAIRAGMRAEQAGRHAEIAAQEADMLARTSMAHAKAGLAAHCASEGVTMPADADWNTLATCGTHLRDTIRASLHNARDAIEANRELSDAQRAQALSGIDGAMADLDREMAAARKS
jgi:bla regulator protein BlaR1